MRVFARWSRPRSPPESSSKTVFWEERSSRLWSTQASAAERGPILEAIFDLEREEIAMRVQAGKLPQSAFAAHDYVNDVF